MKKITYTRTIDNISQYKYLFLSFSFIHKAWRLVLPAAICFLVLAIISLVYAVIITNRLSDYCDEFHKKLNNTAIPCTLLVNRFSLNEKTLLLPSTNLNLSRMLAWLTAVLWTMAFLVMVVRCVIGADFELEEVERYAEGRGTTLDQQPNSPKSRVKFHDDGYNYSKESAYKPNEWSSDLSETTGRTATTSIGQQPRHQVHESENLLKNGNEINV